MFRTDYKDNLDEELGAVLSDESPEASLSEQQQQAIIYHALDKLPEPKPRCRTAVLSRTAVAEHVADLLGITPGAVVRQRFVSRSQAISSTITKPCG